MRTGRYAGWRMWVVVAAASALAAAGCKATPDDGKKGGATGPHASVLRLLPGVGNVTDSKPEGDPLVFGPVENAAEGIKALEQDLGPAAGPFKGYGYVKSATQSYDRGGTGDKVTVRVFEMASAAEAFGIYSVASTGTQFPPDLGMAARMSPTTLAFASGAYYVTVEYHGTHDAANVLMEFGRAIAQEIGSAGNRPTLLLRFPIGAQEGQMYYLHKFETLAALPFFPRGGSPADIGRRLALSGDTDVAIVGYPTRRPNVLNYLFVIQYPTEAQAKIANNSYREYLSTTTNPAEKLVAVPDQPVQTYVVGTLNAMENSDNDRLAELIKSLSPPPPAQP
jgi:hypothetical protein